MRLLVSVADAVEARSALDGGADFIDAKDPRAGALGAVSLDTLQAICSLVAGRRVVTAALGDAADEAAIERDARTFASSGVGLVKVGFAGITDPDRVSSLIRAAVDGARSAGDRCGVVAVAYADAVRGAGMAPRALADAAAASGAVGVLLDTADKRGPSTRQLMTAMALAEWVAHAHDAGLIAAVAGKLTAPDLTCIRGAGADVAGVRGAACEGGRTGRVATEKVRYLARSR